MKPTIPLAVAILCAAGSGPSWGDSPPELSVFADLAGCWAMERDGRRYEEWWMPPAADQMLGMARTLKDGRTVAFEYTRIVRDEMGLAYLAYPSGRGPTRFGLTSLRGSTASFENPQHDFPTRIVYALKGHERLDASIGGVLEGKNEDIAYPFRRVACPPAH